MPGFICQKAKGQLQKLDRRRPCTEKYLSKNRLLCKLFLIYLSLMKVRAVYSGPENTIEPNVIVGYCFECPGCKTMHEFTTNPKFRTGGVWTFNGNLDQPSFSPSLLVNKITDGKIKFYDNCDHDLKNQTVELFDIKTD